MTLYELSQEEKDRLSNTYTYHAPTPNQVKKYEMIREDAGNFAKLLMMYCPRSRELSIALTHLEECVMQANASIARNEDIPDGRE